jgi:uncharacterized SAM-binding protein YcdF (DUF218 family)
MFLTLLLLITILLLVLQRTRSGLGLLAVALGLFWLSGDGVFAAQLLRPLQSPYQRLERPRWGARNAVILLGAGTTQASGGAQAQPAFAAYSRILEAVRLYRNGRAAGKPCTLIISGGDPGGHGVSEAAVYRTEVLALGVPDQDLVLEDKSMNTFQNAQYTSALLQAQGFDQVVLVTSGLHMKRAMLYFEHFHAGCQPAPSDLAQPMRAWVPLGYNLALADFAVHEHLGVVKYWTYNLLGLNAKVPTKAGAV